MCLQIQDLLNAWLSAKKGESNLPVPDNWVWPVAQSLGESLQKSSSLLEPEHWSDTHERLYRLVRGSDHLQIWFDLYEYTKTKWPYETSEEKKQLVKDWYLVTELHVGDPDKGMHTTFTRTKYPPGKKRSPINGR